MVLVLTLAFFRGILVPPLFLSKYPNSKDEREEAVRQLLYPGERIQLYY